MPHGSRNATFNSTSTSPWLPSDRATVRCWWRSPLLAANKSDGHGEVRGSVANWASNCSPSRLRISGMDAARIISLAVCCPRLRASTSALLGAPAIWISPWPLSEIGNGPCSLRCRSKSPSRAKIGGTSTLTSISVPVRRNPSPSRWNCTRNRRLTTICAPPDSSRITVRLSTIGKLGGENRVCDACAPAVKTDCVPNTESRATLANSRAETFMAGSCAERVAGLCGMLTVGVCPARPEAETQKRCIYPTSSLSSPFPAHPFLTLRTMRTRHIRAGRDAFVKYFCIGTGVSRA